ncbi:MAG TPA: type IVB secretion system protein IcmH/DotU [candidate division Zixibacteria bacterium]|jgi:type VI secretion system protein ImpK
MSTTAPGVLQRACRRAFSLVLNLQDGGDFGDADALRRRVTEMLASMESDAKQAGVLAEDVLSARFALTAFIDETINRSDWPGKSTWANRPLSLEHFNTNRAGEEFFERLAAIRQRPEAQTDLLEVYHCCLALGFEGRYALADPTHLQQLVESTMRELERIRGTSAVLAPHGDPPAQSVAQLGGEVPLWVYSGALAALAFIVFVILRVLSTSQAQETADRLIRLLQ